MFAIFNVYWEVVQVPVLALPAPMTREQLNVENEIIVGKVIVK